MTDVAAAIGLAQMKRYNSLLRRRREIVEKYNNVFGKLNVKILQHENIDKTSSFHLYIVRLLGLSIDQRNKFIELMAESGVACNVHYKPLPMLTAYKKLGFDIKNFPNAFNHYHDEITLPLHTRLSNKMIRKVIESFLENYEFFNRKEQDK